MRLFMVYLKHLVHIIFNSFFALSKEYDGAFCSFSFASLKSFRSILEGGGTLAEIWKREAKRRRLACQWVSAEQWRRQLLLPREQRHGSDAKSHADHLARRVIDWSGAPRPTSLRHDAAEAILIGLWGAVQTGLLPNIPAVIRH